MGIVKRMQLEEAEEEYNRRIRELQRELDELYPDEDLDAEVYEAFLDACEKDD